MVGVGWPSVALADALLWIVTDRQTDLNPLLYRPSVVGSSVKWHSIRSMRLRIASAF